MNLGLPPHWTLRWRCRNDRSAPQTEVGQCYLGGAGDQHRRYTERLGDLEVMTSSNLVGSPTGRSAGLCALEDASGRNRKLTSRARKDGNSPKPLPAVASKAVGPENVSVASEEHRYLKIGRGSNQWPQRHLLVEMLCDALQHTRVRQRERPIRLREHSHSPEPRHRLVGVHARQTERIREVLLI